MPPCRAPLPTPVYMLSRVLDTNLPPVFPSCFFLTCASFVQLPWKLGFTFSRPRGVKTLRESAGAVWCRSRPIPSRPWSWTARKQHLCCSWWWLQCRCCCHLPGSILSRYRMSPRILSWVTTEARITVWPVCCALFPDFSFYVRERGMFYYSVGPSTFCSWGHTRNCFPTVWTSFL